MMEISTAYDKAAKWPAGHGYAMRTSAPTSIVIHTTNGRRGSSFEAEARFLRDSPDVSAHYLVGQQGQVAMLLDPWRYTAWHAGSAKAPWLNLRSIGIECHHAVGTPWPAIQKLALAQLCQMMIARAAIPKNLIETHRFVALPAGRKVDPSDWPDAQFYAWRDALYQSQPAADTEYGTWLMRVKAGMSATVRQAPERAPDNIAATLAAGTVIACDEIKHAQAVNGDDRWYHMASGLGFIHASALERA